MELKPCPCGNEAHLIFEDGIKVADPWSVSCKNLDCPWIFQTFTTREEAVKRWNTRATDQLLKQMAEALERVSEDGHALLSMTIGSRLVVLEALQAYRAHINQIEKPEREGE